MKKENVCLPKKGLALVLTTPLVLLTLSCGDDSSDRSSTKLSPANGGIDGSEWRG